MKILKNILKNPAFISVLLAVLITSCATSKYTISDYDSNGDGKLNQQEFNQTLDATNAYKLADADGNDAVSQNEWNQYLAAINFNTKYDADDMGAFKTWDLNGDSTLSKKELYNGIFNTVDGDVSGNDTNINNNNNTANDGFVEQAEWNQWYDRDMF